MSRRSHQKSRNGCANCKRRHMKCDETRPQCVNCTTAQRRCQYLDEEMRFKTSTPPTAISASVSARIQGSLHDQILQQAIAMPPTTTTTHLLNLEHLGLLHQYCTRTCDTFHESEAQRTVWRTGAVDIARDYPFLMYQILAIGALHRSVTDLEKRAHYLTIATELRTAALAGCIAEMPKITSQSCTAILLFSSLNTIHLLGDPTHGTDTGFDEYFDSFLNMLCMLRVTRTIFQEWREVMIQSVLAPVFGRHRGFYDFESTVLSPELESLLGQINSTIQDPSLFMIYEKAVRELGGIFIRLGTEEKLVATFDLLLLWLVKIEEEFVAQLRSRQPVALVILAYYAALLHSHRNLWAISDTGKRLIGAISTWLGPAWDGWLTWPKGMIQHDLSSKSSVAGSPNTSM